MYSEPRHEFLDLRRARFYNDLMERDRDDDDDFSQREDGFKERDDDADDEYDDNVFNQRDVDNDFDERVDDDERYDTGVKYGEPRVIRFKISGIFAMNSEG